MSIAPVPTPSISATASIAPTSPGVLPAFPVAPTATPSGNHVSQAAEHSANLFSSVEPGSWPDWLAAVGTTLAFLVAAVSYWRSVNERREEQARLIYSRVVGIEFHEPGAQFSMSPHLTPRGIVQGGVRIEGPATAEIVTADGGTVPLELSWLQAVRSGTESHFVAVDPVVVLTVAVHNGSKELIAPAKVKVVNIGRKTILDDLTFVLDLVAPESEERVYFVWKNGDHPGQPNLGASILFRDSSSQWWRRHLVEPIERVSNDPENSRWASTRRSSWAEWARTSSPSPAPEPSPLLRARWHRAWRKLRGKAPLP